MSVQYRICKFQVSGSLHDMRRWASWDRHGFASVRISVFPGSFAMRAEGFPYCRVVGKIGIESL